MTDTLETTTPAVPETAPLSKPVTALSVAEVLKESKAQREWLNPNEIAALGPFFIVAMSWKDGGLYGPQITYDVEWRNPNNGEKIAEHAFSLSAKSDMRVKIYHFFLKAQESDPNAVIGPTQMFGKKFGQGSKPMFLFRDASPEDFRAGTFFGGIDLSVLNTPPEQPALPPAPEATPVETPQTESAPKTPANAGGKRKH